MYLELKHHHGVLPKLENIIAYGSKVLKSYSKNPHDYDEELNSYFKIPGSYILSALDDVFLALNVEQKDLLESKIKPDLTFEDHKAGNKVLKLVQSVCISSLKLNGHKPPPFTKLESILFIAYPEAVSDTYTSEVDITQLASRDRIWAPILEDIITNKGEVLEVSTSKRASLRLALFLNKLDTVLENPSKYVRPHPFYLHWAALSADEVVEKGGVYSFSCKSGKDRTSMAVEVRAVHFAIKAVNMVFEEIRSTTDTFDSNLIKLARQKLEKLKVKVIHKKVSELTPAQVKEFYSVYGFTKSRKPQRYTKMHPDLQRLLDQALSMLCCRWQSIKYR